MEISNSKVEAEIGGRTLTIERSTLAPQANSSVTVRYGDTLVLVTATVSSPRQGMDFFPLLVDFEEKMYAAGRMPGIRFTRREGRPPEAAILSARLIDRTIRPLFPDGARNDVQVVITPLSYDGENYLDIPGLIGASAALSTSNIPWDGPVGAVRIGMIDGQFILNPTRSELADSQLDLIVAATSDGVNMIEAGANQISEDQIFKAMEFAYESLQPLVKLQSELAAHSPSAKMEFTFSLPAPELVEAAQRISGKALLEAPPQSNKAERDAQMDNIKNATREELAEQFPGRESEFDSAIEKVIKESVRSRLLNSKIRPDGRTLDEIRPLSCQTNLLPRTHGSGVFQRGETQVLTITTLGATTDIMLIDSLLEKDATKRFMHHYNFPPYSVGETRPMRTPGRRELGHGALAERALLPILPDPEDFPYTIRLVSECLSSNGSTSMASVCGSILSLMDAGVPIKAPAAGISIGLISNNDEAVLLTDIQGLEDFSGDMDFKVAGTRDGITGIQMDLKIKGLSFDLINQTLEKARIARGHILDKIAEEIAVPRAELSSHAPRIEKLQISPEKIGDVIGPRGKHIREIEEKTEAEVQVDQDGTVFITCPNLEQLELAKELVLGYAATPEVGEKYSGTVTRVMDSFALAEILPGTEGLIHISEWAYERTSAMTDVCNVGDEVELSCISVDDTGRIRLSRKALMERPEGYFEPPKRPERDRRPSSRGRDRGPSQGGRDRRPNSRR